MSIEVLLLLLLMMMMMMIMMMVVVAMMMMRYAQAQDARKQPLNSQAQPQDPSCILACPRHCFMS
jgi:flagellar basal body-associated protein FliL